MGRIRIGVSGWDYEEWRGDFYPMDLARKEELAYVGSHFDTVEVNGTFYGLLKPAAFRKWYNSVPRGFVFAVKASRFITHNKKLNDVGSALANFLASGVLELDDKLGPMLWQLPAQLRFDAKRIETFLDLLPHDTNAAITLAKRHDDRIGDPAYGPGRNHRIHHVLEVRHESWFCPELVTIARNHGTAIAFSHSSRWPYTEEITAGFAYVRLHGPQELYSSPYGSRALRRWAQRVERWRCADQPEAAVRITDRAPPERGSRDVYVYFDNDGGGHAPRDAAILRELIDRRRPPRRSELFPGPSPAAELAGGAED